MAALTASYHPIHSLDAATRRAMFELFSRYYARVSARMFEQDLENKSVAILLTGPDRKLQGFTTLEVITFESESGPATAIYSGDTIISHHYWGEQQLSYAWCYFAGQLKQQRPHSPLYWFLIVKGHRTYRYLPAFTRRFYPNWREETPADIQRIMDQLATEKFAAAYQAETGVLHFPEPHGHLRSEWAEPGESLMQKPSVAFFMQRNPGHSSGDELVCITELSESNMRFVSRTAFLEGMKSCQDGLIFNLESPASATR